MPKAFGFLPIRNTLRALGAKLVKLNPREALLAIKPDTTDDIIAMMIAESLIFYNRTAEFRYRINHDVRPPKCLACPLDYDWAQKGHVGIETISSVRARKWLTSAALHDYTIQECDAKRQPLLGDWMHSIEIARMRAERHQRPKPEIDDDDIPF